MMRDPIKWWIAVAIWLWGACQIALSHPVRYHSYQPYVQPAVTQALGKDDILVVLGDSTTGRGPDGGSWIDFWQQYCDTNYPQYNFKIYQAGYGYLSSTFLNYPGMGDFYWQTRVVALKPTVLIIWFGIDDCLFYGNGFSQEQLGINYQQVIDAARQIPSVREIVLVTPFLAGEQPDGWNPHDVGIHKVIQVLQATSANNRIPVIDMHSMGVSAEQMYNPGHYSHGILTGDGIHPFCSQSQYGDHVNFYSALCEQLWAGNMIRGFGM